MRIVAAQQSGQFHFASRERAHTEIAVADAFGAGNGDVQIYRPLERSLCNFLAGQKLGKGLVDWMDRRRRTPLLIMELQALDQAIGDLTECTLLPSTSSLANAWGCIYVLEGSTLGGQTLTRHLRIACPELSQSEPSFLNPYGSQTGPMWREFCDDLVQYHQQTLAPDDEAKAIILAAKQTFQCYGDWLAKAFSQDGGQ